MNDDNPVLPSQDIGSDSVHIDETATKANRWRDFVSKKNKEKKGICAKWGTLVGTLALFVILSGLDNIWLTLTALVPIILLHEFSHLVAMRLSGYTDLSVFFVPMLGAAAVGKEQNPTQIKRAIVALAGPLSGIILGGLLILATDWNQSEYLTSFVQFLFLLNLFNLLPIRPLDGGHIIEALVISRSAAAAIFFVLISPVLLVLIALSMGDFVFGVFAMILLLSSISEIKLIRLVGNLRKQGIYSSSISLSDIPDIKLLKIIDSLKERFKDARDDTLAALLERVIGRMGVARASIGATVGLMFAYLGAILFGSLVFFFGYMWGAQDDPEYQGRRISEWVTMLNSQDVETKEQADQILRQAVTQTQDYIVRDGAITTIGRLGPQGSAAARILYDTLEKEVARDDFAHKPSEDPYHVQNLVGALSNIGPGVLESAPDAPLLIGHCLFNPDAHVRGEAAIALANIGLGNTNAMDMLVNAMSKEREVWVKQEMLDSLSFLALPTLTVETDSGLDTSAQDEIYSTSQD